MAKKKSPISCDWKSGATLKSRGAHKENKSTLYKHKDRFRWQGIKVEKYKQSNGDWADIVRQTLIGNKRETCKFHLRYFEIAAGGCSSFERHKHEHVVICVRGKGKAIADKKSHILNFLDTLYISPDTPHQLRNPFKSPFGFLCIVNAKRDKPKLLTV